MDIKHMKRFSIFNNLEDHELEYFRQVTKAINIKVGQEFIKEGELGDSIFLLVDGTIEINQALTLPLSKRGNDNREKSIVQLSHKLDPPPFFGEMTLFDENAKRTANIKALTDCYLMQIMKDDLFDICDTHMETGYKVMQKISSVLCEKLVTANTNVLKLTTAFSLVLER